MKNFYLLLTIALFTTSIALAQSNQWRNYYDNSLISTLSIHGDELWIGGNGIVRLNTQTLNKQFYNPANVGLNSLWGNKIDINDEGEVWVLDQLEGIGKYDNGTFSYIDTTGANFPNSTSEILVTNNNSIWINTWGYYSGNGIYHFNGSTWEHFNENNSGLPENTIQSIANESDGKIWMGTNSSGIVSFDGDTWTLFNTENSGLAGDNTKALFVDENNILWIATESGISKYDGNTWNTINFSLLDPSSIKCMMVNNNNIWVGTSEGLYNYGGSDWIEYTDSNSSLPNNSINALEMDDFGKLYVGTSDGLVSFKDDTWINYDISQSGINGNDVDFIGVDNQNNKWIYCRDLVKFNGEDEWTIYDENNSPIDHISSIHFDDNDLAWLVDWEDGLRTFDGETWGLYNTDNSGIATNEINDLTISESNTKWIATDVGVSKFDGENWVNYDSANSNLPTGEIRRINCIDDNNVWVGIWENGIGHFNGSAWSVINSSNSELPNEITIYDIAFNNDITYFATDKGIVKIINNEIEIINSENSGLPSNYINDIDFDMSGAMWMTAGGEELIKYHNEEFVLFNQLNSPFFPFDEVYSITVDQNNNKWIGTDDAGCSVYNEDGLYSIGEIFSSAKHINKLLFTPNPSQGNTSMEINISQKSDVLLKVYNNQGQLVYSEKYEGLKNGTHSLSLSTSDYKNGYYHIQVATDNNIWAGKLLIIN